MMAVACTNTALPGLQYPGCSTCFPSDSDAFSSLVLTGCISGFALTRGMTKHAASLAVDCSSVSSNMTASSSGSTQFPPAQFTNGTRGFQSARISSSLSSSSSSSSSSGSWHPHAGRYPQHAHSHKDNHIAHARYGHGLSHTHWQEQHSSQRNGHHHHHVSQGDVAHMAVWGLLDDHILGLGSRSHSLLHGGRLPLAHADMSETSARTRNPAHAHEAPGHWESLPSFIYPSATSSLGKNCYPQATTGPPHTLRQAASVRADTYAGHAALR
jgi:hypothetical protein